MKKTFIQLSLVSAVALFAASCKNDKKADPTPTFNYEVPTTYNFANANFTDATTTLGMATEIGNYFKLGLAGPIDAQVGINMFNNTGNPFTGTAAAYNASGLSVGAQSNPQFKIDAQYYIDTLAALSHLTTTASRGVAGLGTGGNASKYLLTANGRNYAQIFNKSLMGGLIVYQIVNNYITAGVAASVDNTTVVAGKGTAMEHNWDQAFGFWSVPIDFPTNKTGAKFFGSYSTQVDEGYKANQILMDAFLKGRAAISNKDTKTRDAQVVILLQAWEKLTAAAALQEVKEAKADISDDIIRNSRLSECYGFVHSLKYNPKKTITDAKVDEILALFPANFYDLTLVQLNAIRDAISTQYGFDAVKDVL